MPRADHLNTGDYHKHDKSGHVTDGRTSGPPDNILRLRCSSMTFSDRKIESCVKLPVEKIADACTEMAKETPTTANTI